MNDACSSPVARRRRPWALGLALLTLATVFGASWGLENLDLSRGGRLALALLPVAIWGGAIVYVARSIRSLDEMQVRIQLVALAIAFPTAMLLGFTVEYLQKAGFVEGWTIGDVWPWMLLLYVPALAIAHWRYR